MKVEFNLYLLLLITSLLDILSSERSAPLGSGLPGGILSSLFTAFGTKLLSPNKSNRQCPFTSALTVNDGFCFAVSLELMYTTLFNHKIVT